MNCQSYAKGKFYNRRTFVPSAVFLSLFFSLVIIFFQETIGQPTVSECGNKSTEKYYCYLLLLHLGWALGRPSPPRREFFFREGYILPARCESL